MDEREQTYMKDARASGGQNNGLTELYLRLEPGERRQTFITTRDAARDIGVAQRTLQTWIAEGRLAAVRVGGRYLVHAPSLESFVRHAVDE